MASTEKVKLGRYLLCVFGDACPTTRTTGGGGEERFNGKEVHHLKCLSTLHYFVEAPTRNQ